MPRKDILKTIAEELPKYRIEILGLSILPFALNFRIVYLPTEEEVGYVKWTIFTGVEAFIQVYVDGKKIKITYKKGAWSISE